MKLKPTTSLNDAIKRLSEGHPGAANTLALLVAEHPEHALKFMHALDRQKVYGRDLAHAFFVVAEHDLKKFLMLINGGNIQAWLLEQDKP